MALPIAEKGFVHSFILNNLAIVLSTFIVKSTSLVSQESLKALTLYPSHNKSKFKVIYHNSMILLLNSLLLEGIGKIFPHLCKTQPQFINFEVAPHDENKIQGPLRVSIC